MIPVTLTVDPNPCHLYRWSLASGPCRSTYSGAHVCDRPGGHRGACRCGACGAAARGKDRAREDRRPIARLIPRRLEVPAPRAPGPGRPGRPGYRWVDGYQVVTPEGEALFPYMTKADARRVCRENGWAMEIGPGPRAAMPAPEELLP
jgi:hypothetical protein